MQKRSKKTERSEKVSIVTTKDGNTKEIHKFKKKKRYGHSIKNRSPGLMQQCLKDKTVQYDIPDFDACDADFDRFVELHDAKIQQMKANGISFKQCFGF